MRNAIGPVLFCVVILAAVALGGEPSSAADAPGSQRVQPSTAPSRPVPDFGLMWNNDGDLSFTGPTPAESVRNLRIMVDRLAGTPVKLVCQSVGAGSDILYYPTKVASTWGWRTLPNDPEPQRRDWAKAGTDAGVDAPRVVAEEVRRLGIQFVPSLRMNDAHFAARPLEDPLTSRFWMEHHDKLTIGKGNSPVHGGSFALECENLLDYSKKEVRDFRLAQINEMIDRYQDVMTGLELDFNRVQVFFPRGKADFGAPLMTDLVRKVRRRLDDVGAARGQTYYLFVRVPPTLKNCRWAGLDVPLWMRQRLVDVVIPAQLMTLSHDMPIDEFVAIAAPAGCKLYPAIYPRAAYHWPFVEKPGPNSYAGGPDRRASVEMVRGAASNYWHMGASGFQLFNFGWPDDDWTILAIHALTRPEALAREDRTYAVTASYYLDSEDTYEYRKQIPLTINPGRTGKLVLVVGERFDEPAKAPPPDFVALRLGLRDAAPQMSAEIALNGTILHQGPLEPVFTVTGAKDLKGGANPDPPTAYLQLPISQLSLIQAGQNQVQIRLQGGVAAPVTVSECQLGVRYHSRLFSW